MSFRQTLETLERTIPRTVSWVVSTFPRGDTQIIQPAKIPPSLLKSYARDYHAEDRGTWQAIKLNKTLTEQECFEGAGGFERSRYHTGFLQPGELRHMAVAPLAGPIFPGYPGALHVYRSADQGAFTASDLQHLSKLAKQYDQAIESGRQSRLGKIPASSGWNKRPPARQFIFDAHLKPLLGEAGLGVVEDRVREGMLRHAKLALSRVVGASHSSDRITLPDARGDLWVFRAVTWGKFPALSDGPIVFYCMQPDCRDWSALRAADVVADTELSRLVPAMQFMHKEFGRGPTLNEIAQQVDLSPFHYHRRFTELFGITPKHFLLECQIYAAKSHMFAGDKDLVEIANFCGFAHQSHFTSRFKQATGLTPTGWRRLCDELRQA